MKAFNRRHGILGGLAALCGIPTALKAIWSSAPQLAPPRFVYLPGNCANKDAAGSPVGSITPDYVGQYYRDTATGNVWRSTGSTSADWVLAVQDMGVSWTPTSLDFGANIEYVGNMELEGVSSLVFSKQNMLGGVYLDGQFLTLSPSTISFPNLLTVDPEGNAWASIVILNMAFLESVSDPLVTEVGTNVQIMGCNLLTSVIFTSLASVGWMFQVTNNPSLTSISLPNFTGRKLDLSSCANLSTVSVPSFLPTNGDNVIVTSGALTEASVNHILSRCVASSGYVSGIVSLDGGTNAAPSGQGITDKNTLIARGCTINTN